MSNGLRLKIADIVFFILPTDGIKGFSLDKNYIPFITDEEPDVVLKVVTNAHPLISPAPSLRKRGTHFIPPFLKGERGGLSGQKPFFDASTWNYEQADGRHIFNFSLSPKNNRPERILALEPDYKKGEIILTKVRGLKNGILQSPFVYPLDQLLMISLLPQMQGLFVHSCGFKYKDKGYLFIGSSGAGKSTLSEIIEKNKRVHVLSDDRIAVRKKRGNFYIYGTPWHGTAEIVSPEMSPLSGLFFLKKDAENSLRKISISDAVSRLFKCSFPPFWDRDGIASALKLCEDIARAIPCFEFSFTPDDRAFELIRKEQLI